MESWNGGMMECCKMRLKPFSHFSNIPVEKTSWLLCAMLFALCVSAQAQQPKKVPRIGILIPSSVSFLPARVEAFRQRLREHGYVEGKNIFIEYRYAEGETRTGA
jgi:ABC-type uncharacterized transport system substrate-binding protein